MAWFDSLLDQDAGLRTSDRIDLFCKVINGSVSLEMAKYEVYLKADSNVRSEVMVGSYLPHVPEEEKGLAASSGQIPSHPDRHTFSHLTHSSKKHTSYNSVHHVTTSLFCDWPVVSSIVGGR